MAKQLIDVSTKEIVLDVAWPSMDKLESKLVDLSERIRQRRNE